MSRLRAFLCRIGCHSWEYRGWNGTRWIFRRCRDCERSQRYDSMENYLPYAERPWGWIDLDAETES